MSKKSGIGKHTKSYYKYIGLGYHLVAIILVSYYGGGYLDRLMNNSRPYCTVLITLILFAGFMYKLYLDLLKK